MYKQCVVIKAKVPSHKISAATERNQEALKKYPRDAMGGTVLAYVGKTSLEGLETELIIEPAEGKLEAEIQHAVTRLQMFNDIDGCEYAIEVYGLLNKPI